MHKKPRHSSHEGDFSTLLLELTKDSQQLPREARYNKLA